ncbi:MAG: hypothetical protein EOP06_21100 [Proteobacteria bacterium]|nr:MAG: hypothetical protein EOP06_21100 [Pseudomonadota bacterium]
MFRSEVERHIGYLDQQPDLNDAMTVMEVVLAGDSAQLDAVRAYEHALTSGDHTALERAMSQRGVRLLHLKTDIRVITAGAMLPT